MASGIAMRHNHIICVSTKFERPESPPGRTRAREFAHDLMCYSRATRQQHADGSRKPWILIPPKRLDETPKTFAELKPPGYYSATLGRFVGVRRVTAAEFWAKHRDD